MQTDGIRLWAQLMWRAVIRNREVLSLYSEVGWGGSRLRHAALPMALHVPADAGCSAVFPESFVEAREWISFTKWKEGVGVGMRGEDSISSAIGLSPKLQSDHSSLFLSQV